MGFSNILVEFPGSFLIIFGRPKIISGWGPGCFSAGAKKMGRVGISNIPATMLLGDLGVNDGSSNDFPFWSIASAGGN